MDAQDTELARQAVGVLREALAGRGIRAQGRNGAALVASVHGLAVYLLVRCVDPEDIERGLTRIDSVLADRLADALLKGVDWDALNWAV